jgi:hypothetical protein
MIQIGYRHTGQRTEYRCGGCYEHQNPPVDLWTQRLLLANPRPNWLGRLFNRLRNINGK